MPRISNYERAIEIFEPNKKGFSHKIVFELQKNGDFTNLCYSLSGTYGGKVQNISFKPILKRVLKEEIKKIKIAIESSDSVPENLNIGNISPWKNMLLYVVSLAACKNCIYEV